LGIGVLLGAVVVYFAIVPRLAAKAAANEAAAQEVVRLQERIANQEKAHEERVKVYETAEKVLKDSFDAISLKNLKLALEEHKKLSDGDIAQRAKSIEELLKPFQERLKDLDETNRDIEKERKGAYGSLIEQIKALGEQQTGLTKETNRLVKALQDPGSAGSWGEMVLERVVEMAGLEEHYTFDQQTTDKSEDGDQRPDMIVSLPGGRTLIIDSKAPMRAYMEGLETPDEDVRATFFRTHGVKLYEHAKELKRRDYSKRGAAVDFTVMFIPSESAFRTAVECRPRLIEECMECNVVLATPTTLLALLRAVNYGWQQEKLAQLAKEVQKDGATLYDRITKIVDDYVKLGRALKQAGAAYNDFGSSLEARVLPAARRFKDNGVQTNKEMAAIEQIEVTPRTLTAEDLIRQSALGFVGHEPEESTEP
jgi:DNA recombination protein RmuC